MPNQRNRLSLRVRWRIWRAALTTPALLARYEERKAISWIAAVNGGLAILTISLFAWLTDLPLVFPALGPSTFILFSMPLTPAGAPRSVILGHWISLACGFGVWHLMSYLSGAPVTPASGGWPLYCGAPLALALSASLMLRLCCPHPPACASSLVVALGAVTQWYDLLLMAGVIVWLTFQATAMNRFAGLPVSWWSPRQDESLVCCHEKTLP